MIELYLHFTKKISNEVWVEKISVSKRLSIKATPTCIFFLISRTTDSFKRFVNINCFAYKVLQKDIILVFQKLKKKRKEIKKLVTKKKKEKWNLILKIYLEKVLFYAQVYLFKNVENAQINALIIHQNWAKYSSWCNIFSERDMPFFLIFRRNNH